MQLRTLITVIATLALQLVNTQNVTRGLELQAFPPCAQSCINTGLALSKINRTDTYGICNDPTFLNYIGPCESVDAGKCSDEDRQNIQTRGSALCAPVGGIASTVFTFRFPGLPDCANNCTSSGLRSSGCQGNNITCICKSPTFGNAVGPCVQTVCNATEVADTVSFYTEGCAPVGGIGPFKASDIGGYLNFTGPNRTLLFYPPFYTPENATNVINTTSPRVTPFTGAAASKMMGRHGYGTILGLIGAMMLV